MRNVRGACGVRAMVGSSRAIVAAALLGVVACKQPAPAGGEAKSASASPGSERAGEAGVACPTEPEAREVAPDVAPRHRALSTWLAKLPDGAADEVLVDPARLDALDAGFSEVKGAYRDPLSPSVADPALVAEEVAERTTWMAARVDEGRYVEQRSGSMAQAQRVVASATATDEVRMVVQECPLWCVPLSTGLFKEPIDPAFDRNRCASLHPGELVRVLRRSEGEPSWLYVDSGHTTGWLSDPTLSVVLPIEHLRPLWTGPYLVPKTDAVTTTEGQRVRLGTRVPLTRHEDDGTWSVMVAGPEGPTPATLPADAAVHEGPLPLTRRNLWTMALAELDKPYGWGGTGGARDCSRFLRDMMVSFGIQLGRHSGVQAQLGTDRVDLTGMSDEAKRDAIRRAAARGIVLLYMPGHIMLYLGEDEGRAYAISAISEWLEPCTGGPDTVYKLDRVAVTTLELGRDTERTAYIERLTTLVIFGPPTPA